MRSRRWPSRKCEHVKTVTTVIAGIQRTVCEMCGAVTISYDHATCIDFRGDVRESPDDRQTGVAALTS